MIGLFKKKTIKPSCRTGDDLLANRIAEKIIYYQKKCADRIQKAFKNVPAKVQRIGFTLLFFGSALYCGSLVFKTEEHPVLIKTIKPAKSNKISSADSLQKLEKIHQHYLKR